MHISDWSSDVCSSDLGRGQRGCHMGGLSRSRLCPRADRPCHARDGRARRTALPAQLCRQCGRDRALRIAGLPHPAAGACAGDRAVIDRRTQLAALVAFAAAVLPARSLRALETIMEEDHPQYGLIGQMIAQPGQRGALAAILTEGTDAMPGNFAYIVGEDAENPDALWIVELWADKAAHAASLQLPAVQAAIAKGGPLSAGLDRQRDV